MKKQYKILLAVIIAEFLFLFYFIPENSIQSWLGNAVGVFVFMLPVQVLLFLLSKEEKYTDKKRKVFKIIFWYINLCYVGGAIATFIEAYKSGTLF